MPVIYRTHLRISRISPPLPRRVRHHHLRLLPYLLIRLAQRDRIPITLRHLSPIGPRYPRRIRQHHFRLTQYLSDRKELLVRFTQSLDKVPRSFLQCLRSKDMTRDDDVLPSRSWAEGRKGYSEVRKDRHDRACSFE